MTVDDFYKSFKLINDGIKRYALIDTKDFIRLQRINGIYKWLPLEIDGLPAIPIEIDSCNESDFVDDRIIQISIKPTWKFVSNGCPVVTPNIEKLIFINFLENGEHRIMCKAYKNENFLTTNNWEDALNRNIYAEDKNAVEWKKQFSGLFFGFNSEAVIDDYMSHFKAEIDEFNKVYEESRSCAKELNKNQKTFIR